VHRASCKIARNIHNVDAPTTQEGDAIMTPGIHSMPASQYFAAEGISASGLDLINISPRHYRYHQREETESMFMGTLLHRQLLEPDTLENAYWIKPEGMSFATREGKKWKADHSDRPIVEEGSLTKAIRAVKAIHEHPIARRFLKNAECEKSIFAYDSQGTLRKARLDIFCAGTVLPDVKTSTDARPDEFSKSIWNLEYHKRAAWYLDICNMIGIEKKHFAFIVVEPRPPFCVAVYILDDEAIEIGREQYQAILQTYRNCLETDTWPGYSTEMQPIGLPQWALKQAGH